MTKKYVNEHRCEEREGARYFCLSDRVYDNKGAREESLSRLNRSVGWPRFDN